METTQNITPDDEVSFLSELQRFEKALSDDSSLSSHPVTNGAGVMPSEASKQRKIVYKVTLQPRLSESAQGPEIPPEYQELFEKLQPRIIARGLASDSESLLTLNRSLRPKISSSNNKQTPKSLATEREAPLRVLGGRRMPPEALAVERQLAPWSIRNRGSMTLPNRSKTGCTSPQMPSSRTLPSQGQVIRESQRTSFAGMNGRNGPHLGPTERPHSASMTPTERDLRTRSFCDDDEVGGSWATELFSPIDSSYRNYSQEIFRNARKLKSFSSEEDPEKSEYLRQLIGNQPGPVRSISVDFSGVRSDQGLWSTPATPVFNSPLMSCATISSEDEEEFVRNSLLLRGMKRFESTQGLENTNPSVTASTSEVGNDLSFLSEDPLAPTPTSHRLNAPPIYCSTSPDLTGISSGCDFDPVVTACSKDTGTNNETKLETNPDTDAFNSSSGIDLLFEMMARSSGHPETQMKAETSRVPTVKTCTSAVQQGRAASNSHSEEVDLNSSMSCSAETEWSELTDESSTNAEHRWTAALDPNSSSSWKEDGEPGHERDTQSERGSTRSDDSSNDDGQVQQEDRLDGYMPEVSSLFVSKVTVLLRRPREEQDQPFQPPVATSSGGCRIQQLPIRQLKPIQEWTS